MRRIPDLILWILSVDRILVLTALHWAVEKNDRPHNPGPTPAWRCGDRVVCGLRDHLNNIPLKACDV